MNRLAQVNEKRPLLEVVAQLEFGDLWPDAQLEQTIRYLRGSKSLRIPEQWRSVLQT